MLPLVTRTLDLGPILSESLILSEVSTESAWIAALEIGAVALFTDRAFNAGLQQIKLLLGSVPDLDFSVYIPRIYSSLQPLISISGTLPSLKLPICARACSPVIPVSSR